LELKKEQSKTSFDKRVDEIAAARAALKKCLTACEAEKVLLTRGLEKAEAFAASRFDWPLVVNNQCMVFREMRIGIDKVLDKLEIELLKENEMLRNTATEQFDQPIHQTKNLLHVLLQCTALLESDIARKKEAELLDTKLSTLVSSKTLSVRLFLSLFFVASSVLEALDHTSCAHLHSGTRALQCQPTSVGAHV